MLFLYSLKYKVCELLRSLFMHHFFRCRLSSYAWYRKWHEGRWELWYVPEFHNEMWLLVHSHLPFDYRPIGTYGSPQREIYRFKRKLDPSEYEKFRGDHELHNLIERTLNATTSNSN